MTALGPERTRVAAPRERLWAVFVDPDALARVLPGCESLEADGVGSYRAVLATRLQFLTLRADVTATLRDPEPPRALTLVLDGRPRGLAGTFSATIPIGLEPFGDDQTEVSYEVDLTVTGRLAAFGTPILRDTLRRQVRELVANVERLLATGPAPGPGVD